MRDSIIDTVKNDIFIVQLEEALTEKINNNVCDVTKDLLEVDQEDMETIIDVLKNTIQTIQCKPEGGYSVIQLIYKAGP